MNIVFYPCKRYCYVKILTVGRESKDEIGKNITAREEPHIFKEERGQSDIFVNEQSILD